jgi:hypothetical protein
MNWGSDELHHRSAELGGWTEELHAADPADVDESVPGAVEFAESTGTDPPDTPDSEDPDDSPDGTADATRTCGFCRGSVPTEEARDADGLPVGEFEWIGGASEGETEAYHRECVDAGEGEFLAWTANGVLADETE